MYVQKKICKQGNNVQTPKDYAMSWCANFNLMSSLKLTFFDYNFLLKLNLAISEQTNYK
jgi:hypothetical protein